MENGGLRVQFQDLSGRWILELVMKVTVDRICIQIAPAVVINDRGRKQWALSLMADRSTFWKNTPKKVPPPNRLRSAV